MSRSLCDEACYHFTKSRLRAIISCHPGLRARHSYLCEATFWLPFIRRTWKTAPISNKIKKLRILSGCILPEDVYIFLQTDMAYFSFIPVCLGMCLFCWITKCNSSYEFKFFCITVDVLNKLRNVIAFFINCIWSLNSETNTIKITKTQKELYCLLYFEVKFIQTKWPSGFKTLRCHMLGQGFEPHQWLYHVHVHVGGWKRLSCHTGHQEVSRCHTRGESEESIAHSWWNIQVRDPPWLWNPEQTSPKVQNRGISGPPKMTHVLQRYF